MCAQKWESSERKRPARGSLGPCVRAHLLLLLISPGKLSVGEGGDGRIEHSRSAERWGKGQELGKGRLTRTPVSQDAEALGIPAPKGAPGAPSARSDHRRSGPRVVSILGKGSDPASKTESSRVEEQSAGVYGLARGATWRGLLRRAPSHLDATQPGTSEGVLGNQLNRRESQLTLLLGQEKTQASGCVPSSFSLQLPLPGHDPCHEQT